MRTARMCRRAAMLPNHSWFVVSFITFFTVLFAWIFQFCVRFRMVNRRRVLIAENRRRQVARCSVANRLVRIRRVWIRFGVVRCPLLNFFVVIKVVYHQYATLQPSSKSFDTWKWAGERLVTGRTCALSNRNSRKCDSLCFTRILFLCAVCKSCCCWLLCFCYFVFLWSVCWAWSVCVNMKWLSPFRFAFLSLDQFSPFRIYAIQLYNSLYNLDLSSVFTQNCCIQIVP